MGGRAEQAEHRRVIAQRLLDGHVDQEGIASQRRPARRHLQQAPQQVRQQGGARLVAAEHEQQQHPQHLVVGQAAALVLGHDETRDHVVRHHNAEMLVGGVVDTGSDQQSAAVVDLTLEVGIEARPRRARRMRIGQVVRTREIVGHLGEQVEVILGDAEQSGDHRHRERVGEGRVEIGSARGCHAVDEIRCDLREFGLEPTDGARREPANEQSAELGVLGWVAHETAAAGVLRTGAVLHRPGLDIVQHANYVVVAGHGEKRWRERRVMVHRTFGAQPFVRREGIVERRRAHRVIERHLLVVLGAALAMRDMSLGVTRGCHTPCLGWRHDFLPRSCAACPRRSHVRCPCQPPRVHRPHRAGTGAVARGRGRRFVRTHRPARRLRSHSRHRRGIGSTVRSTIGGRW